jgi:hypothetical protein
VKYILSLCLSLISTIALAGTLTIIPDNTSSMGIDKQRREAQLRAQAERQARIAAGVEQPPRVIIIKQAPPPRRSMDCYSYGSRGRSSGGQSFTCD